MEEIIFTLFRLIWGVPMLIFTITIGLLFTLSTRFLQVRYLKEMVRQIIKGKQSDKGISPFQSLVLSLSGRIGTGNIAGVATAIAFGGPGSLFWMWVIAFFGAGTAFAESTLGQIFKTNESGEYRGGPAYYIEKGIGLRGYAVFVSCIALLAYTVFMPGVQAHTIAASMERAFNLSPIMVGIILVISLFIIFRGGIKRFARFSEIVVPIMSITYFLVAVVVVLVNFRQIPYIFSLIISSAFGRNEIFGGLVGSAISFGVRRGIFSSEAGQGSQVAAAAAAETSHPVKQGLVQAFSIYIDTLIISTATGFMILMTGMYNVITPEGEYLVQNLPHVIEPGADYTTYAIDSVFMGLGSFIVAISIFLFAFTLFISYYYISETNLVYICRGKQKRWMFLILQIVFLIMVFQGTLVSSTLAWAMADIGVGLNVWFNLIALVILYKPLMICFKDYESQYKKGKDPVFNSKKVGIKNAEFWEDK